MQAQYTDDNENNFYKTSCIVLKNHQDDLFKYCDTYTGLSKLFRNDVIFRCRQLFFAHKKGYKNLTELEQQVIDEFALIGVTFPFTNKYKYLPSYKNFVAMFTATNNSDYYNALPQQSKQQMIKKVLDSFKAYDEALKKYYKDLSGFTSKPRLPKYVKGDKTVFIITNQDAVIKNGNVLKLPKTAFVKKNLILNIGKLSVGNLQRVEITPYYDTYKICLVEKVDKTPAPIDTSRILGIDLGVDNFVSTSNNCGLTPFVINGNGLKSYNQWFNKLISNLRSELPKDVHSSKRIRKLSQKRDARTTDFYNKCVSYIVKYCLDNNIGTIVIGKNDGWKQNSNIGPVNNQNFCFIAHYKFIQKLELLAKQHGMTIIKSEESYTSKASFLDNDDIPNYEKGNKAKHTFSGRRIHRGLYKSKAGILINADVNGASNIIKKAVPEAFNNAKDLSYLYKTILKIAI